MQVYQVDLPQWLADCRFRALIDFIDGLPPASRLREAIFNDPEEAERIVAARRAAEDKQAKKDLLGVVDDDDDPPAETLWRPRSSEYDLPAIQRSAIHAQLIALTAMFAKANGGSPPAPQYFPAPRTLVDELTDQADRADYLEALAVVAPHAVGPSGQLLGGGPAGTAD